MYQTADNDWNRRLSPYLVGGQSRPAKIPETKVLDSDPKLAGIASGLLHNLVGSLRRSGAFQNRVLAAAV
jgi:hypothetical protein